MSETDPVELLLQSARDEAAPEVFRVTGVMMQYYVVCKRELWFQSRNLEIDRGNAAIVRGTHVDETAYNEKRRHVSINGTIAIDVLDDGRVMEVKPSSALVEPAKLQLLYYLWYLKHVVGVEKSGVLAHPTERKREDVELDAEATNRVENAIRGIYDIVKNDSPHRRKKNRSVSRVRITIFAGVVSMDRNYHIFSDGTLERHNDTVRLITLDGEKKYLPIEKAEAIYLHGQINYNTRLISFLNKQGTAIHVFGWKDYYAGSIMPNRGQTSGRTLVEQVRAYDDPGRRVDIARKFVDGSIHNMRANVSYYNSRGHEFDTALQALDDARERLVETTAVDETMGVEATARRAYYSTFDDILPDGFVFNGRRYNPPDNETNSLISFGNSLVYANVVSGIRATALDPAVSFLHEPGERRYSLALDIADLFKPLLADRVIFRVLNRNQLTTDDFEADLNSCLLTERGRKTFSKEFEEMLEQTVEHPQLKRKVSYQYLLRLEAYKLKKHLLTGETYVPFKRWW